MFETALADGELITEVAFPIQNFACYVKFSQPASRFALVGVFLARTGDRVRIGVTGAASSAFRFTEAEELLSRSFRTEEIDRSEERRVGNEGVSTGRSRGSP